MKIIINEKQLATVLGMNTEIQEEDDLTTSPSSPLTSTAPSGPEGRGAEDFPAYPEVGHWESGVTRGPANQIATNSNWSDVVGSKLTRGKANPLK